MQVLYVILVASLGLVAVRGDSASTDTDAASASADDSAPSSTLSATTSSTGVVCPLNGGICDGSITICKNTASPAASGTCNTYASAGAILEGAALTLMYTATQVAANAPCPGTCVISVTQNTARAGVVTAGTPSADQTITYSSSTTQSLTFTSLGGDMVTYTIPVTAAIVCTESD